MNPYKVLIVDDEPIARSILESYVALLPQLTLVASCAHAVEALGVLNQEAVDLLLLDIDLPQLNGLAFLKSLPAPPKVIFTTAYHQYALESYEQSALDYLLKPIQFERFLKAVNKLTPAPPPAAPPAAEGLPAAKSDLLFVKSEGKLIRIDLAEVQFVEARKDYLVLHAVSGKRMIHGTMKALEDRLQASAGFLRIHKSHIVNLQFVREVDGNCMRVGTELLTIGATYRDAVQAALVQFRLL